MSPKCRGASESILNSRSGVRRVVELVYFGKQGTVGKELVANIEEMINSPANMTLTI